MPITFHNLSVKDAAIMLKWRSDPEISASMFTDLEHCDLDKQANWIASQLARDDYLAFIIHDDGNPVGFVNFYEIDQNNKRCSSGSYIYCKKARLKLAITLHSYICEFAFNCLGMNKIVNLILDGNEKVIKLQHLHNTQFVGVLKEHIFKNNKFRDVFVFEQLKSPWVNRTRRLELSHIQNAFIDWKDKWIT